jgi:uncharacterized protein YgfB (UPF0149 family)
MKIEEIEQYISEHKRYKEILTQEIQETEKKKLELVNEYIRVEGVLMFLEKLKRQKEEEEKKCTS